MSRSKAARRRSPIRSTCWPTSAAVIADLPNCTLDQIDQQLALAVDRVMTEGSCYDRTLAALAIKQARGDLVEAIFLLRAYRTTLPRFGDSEPLDTDAAWSPSGASRRPSRTCRAARCWGRPSTTPIACSISRWPRPAIDPHAPTAPVDAGQAAAARRRHPRTRRHARAAAGASRRARRRTSPARRWSCRPTAPVRLQNLARGDEGFLLALGYSTQRGYGNNHPFVGEIRFGAVPVDVRAGGVGLRDRDRRDRRHRMRHGQPVRGLARRAAAIHARLWAGFRPRRAQGDGHGAGRPRAARRASCRRAPPRPRRTRSSCCPIPTMSRPRASCST